MTDNIVKEEENYGMKVFEYDYDDDIDEKKSYLFCEKEREVIYLHGSIDKLLNYVQSEPILIKDKNLSAVLISKEDYDELMDIAQGG